MPAIMDRWPMKLRAGFRDVMRILEDVMQLGGMLWNAAHLGRCDDVLVIQEAMCIMKGEGMTRCGGNHSQRMSLMGTSGSSTQRPRHPQVTNTVQQATGIVELGNHAWM